MNYIKSGLIALLFAVLPAMGFAQESDVDMSTSEPADSGVMAVYGVSADDYLDATESTAEVSLSSREKKSRPVFIAPPAFYIGGGLVFMILFAYVLRLFMKGFEEKDEEKKRESEKEILSTDIDF